MMTSSNGNIFRVLALCAGNSPVAGEFPAQRAVMRNFDVFFDLRLNKQLSKQSWRWWFETQQVSETKYLGVNISEDLHWSKHIQGLASKASSTLGLLRRNLSLCPQKLREQAYISLIRSRLEYSAAIWDPHLEKDIQQLEAIQRRAARFVVQDFSRYSSVKSYLNDLKWAPLKDRRRDIRLTFLFKIVTGRVAVQAEDTLLPADSQYQA